jgi:hypothetical protein
MEGDPLLLTLQKVEKIIVNNNHRHISFIEDNNAVAIDLKVLKVVKFLSQQNQCLGTDVQIRQSRLSDVNF